jgi:hypothetical protein
VVLAEDCPLEVLALNYCLERIAPLGVHRAERERRRAAGIPEGVRYRPRGRIARGQLLRRHGNGSTFDWLAFDEGYGAAVPLREVLNLVGQRFVAEGPVHCAVADGAGGRTQPADQRLSAADAKGGKRSGLTRRTARDAVGRAATAKVWGAGREHLLSVAIPGATAAGKSFRRNAPTTPVARLWTAAFGRWGVAHGSRRGKQEAGLRPDEGRDYTGRIRRRLLASVGLGFVATQAERLRGEKAAGDGGAGVPGVKPAVGGAAASPSGRAAVTTHECGHPLAPAPQPTGDPVPQKTAA